MFIRQIIERVTAGDIRIPAFQRGYVWEPEQAAFLLDSVFKGFPIGTIVLWQTDERLSVEKSLGSFELPAPKKDYPVNYVLDGQQRLTSLFSVFQTVLVPVNNDWIDIYYDIDAEESLQESVFLALNADEVDVTRHFPVKTLFTTVEYRDACDVLGDREKIKKVDSLQAKFKEYDVQTQTFESDDRSAVAIVFERINRAGTELKVFELLSAWSWSDDFDLVESFSSLQDEIRDHGYADLCDEQDLQLRICAGVITGETSPAKIIDLKGDEIRKRFPEIRAGILGAVDFLKRELNARHYNLIPFPGALIPLSCFFATDKPDGVTYTDNQKQQLLRWFWRATFSRRYSSDVNERQAQDIRELVALRANPNHGVRMPAADIKVDFERGNFLSSSASSKALILMLAQHRPHSFLSGAQIDLDRVLKRGSKHEFHHVFPQKFLSDRGLARQQINVLANICFLTRADNVKISANAPSSYVAEMPQDRKDQYLQEALCPVDLDNDDYEKFIDQRVELLTSEAKILMGV